MITVRFTGDRQLMARLEAIPPRVHDALFSRITALTAELEARVQGAEPAKTGQLRSETVPSVTDQPGRIQGKVRVAKQTAKAAALEYGAHGGAHVRAHTARLDHVFGRLVSPMTVTVKAYTRRVNIAEHKYLRGPFDAMEQEIVDQLMAAVEEALG